MIIKQDWHIHSEHSCDGACLNMADLVIETEQLGILNYGISDHLHTSYNIPDMVNSRKCYDSIISKNPALKKRFYFGIEVSCVSEWELGKIRIGDYQGDVTYGLRRGGPPNSELGIGIDREYIEQMGIEYVVGGVHWPLYCDLDRDSLLKDYHRQYMFMAQHKDVDILAHYLWWNPLTGVENPFSDFSSISPSMKQELAVALKESGCAFEINLEAILMSPSYTDKFKREYLDYASEIQSMGVIIAVGSDCHSRHYSEVNFELSSKMLEESGLDFEGNIFTVPKK